MAIGWADVRGNDVFPQSLAVDHLRLHRRVTIKIDLLVERVLFDVGQDSDHDTTLLWVGRWWAGPRKIMPPLAARRELFVGIVVHVQGQADLLEIIDTGRPAGRLAGLLHGW